MNLQYEIRICRKIHNKGTMSQWQIQVTIFLSGTDVSCRVLWFAIFRSILNIPIIDSWPCVIFGKISPECIIDQILFLDKKLITWAKLDEKNSNLSLVYFCFMFYCSVLIDLCDKGFCFYIPSVSYGIALPLAGKCFVFNRGGIDTKVGSCWGTCAKPIYVVMIAWPELSNQ